MFRTAGSTGILTSFPFGHGFSTITLLRNYRTTLGPTDPCTFAGDTEPFSASASKAVTWIFATFTKICAGPVGLPRFTAKA